MDLGQLGPHNLRRLLDAVLGVGTELDLERALRRIVEAAVALVDARYGALGVLDETKQQLAAFITVGADDATHRRIGALPKGLGLLGALIDESRPLRAPVIAEHPSRSGFPPGHPPMTSFLGVPITMRDEVFGNLYLTDKTTAEGFDDLDEQLVSGLAAAASVVIENARLYGRVQRRDATLTAIYDIVTELAGSTDGRVALRLVADRARHLVDADVATVALPAGGSELVMDIVAGDTARELQGRRFAAAGSVSGEVLATGRPVVLLDASRDHRSIQPQVGFGHLGPSVWVPLVANGVVAGTLSVARHLGRPPFTETEIELMQLFAGHAGVILEVDQGRAAAERVSVLHAQERIARDLHDRVVQRLFATGLSLQAATRVTQEPATARLQRAIDDLDETIREIRTVIFGLEHPMLGSPGTLRSSIADTCAEAARVLGFEPAVVLDPSLDERIAAEVAADAVAVVREALANVARHATATAVTVEASLEGGWLHVVVNDDGAGYDPPERVAGRGVANMRARAERHGGAMQLARLPTGGTSMRWSAPVTPVA